MRTKKKRKKSSAKTLTKFSPTMHPPDFDRLIQEQLHRLESEHQRRERVVVRAIDATHLEIDGRRYVNFASNDYLGLTHHPRVRDAIARSLECGAGSGAAGLISGYTDA